MSRTTVTKENDLLDYGLATDILSLFGIHGYLDGDSELTVEDATDPWASPQNNNSEFGEPDF